MHYINNGIDLSEFNVNMQRYKIEDFDLANDKTFNIIYLGSIRLANNLKLLIDSAKILQNNSVQVLIYGDGEDRAFLEHYCEEQQITNVKFKAKWTSPEYVPYILSKADVNALNYSTNFGKYGGSMNKMFLGLASGKPLCCNVGMPYSIILEEGCRHRL
ncbi:glycosyltransferase [Bacteroides ovatus]|nr:glycosyltransferase [Bacteroides ovatus]